MTEPLEPQTETEKLQAIYDMEQNISLTWFWDSGVKAVFGDEINGQEWEYFITVGDAIDWLYDKAAKARREGGEWVMS